MYIREELDGKELKNINRMSIKGTFECAAAQCFIGKESIVVLSVYRGQNDIDTFLSKFEEVLSKLIEDRKKVFIGGDFNIDMLRDTRDRRDFVSLLGSFGLRHAIEEWTRYDIASQRYSCLDNFLIHCEQECSVQVLHLAISDHSTQKLTFDCGISNSTTFKRIRSFSVHNKMQFLDAIKQQDWMEVYGIDNRNVNKKWNSFINTFLNIFNSCFPLHTVRNRKCNYKNIEWYNNPEISACKKKLDILLVLSRKNRNYQEDYKLVKKHYDNLLCASRADKYEQKIKKSDNKSKCLWSIYKDIVSEDVSTDRVTPFEGDPQEIAENCNEYLTEVIPELLSKLKQNPFICKLSNNNKSFFYIN